VLLSIICNAFPGLLYYTHYGIGCTCRPILYTSLKFDCANSSAEYIIDLHGNGPPTKYSRMMESRLVILVDYQRVSAGCYGCDTDTFAFIDHSARANCVSQRRI